MKREKTVIDVEVSEEKQREIVSTLLRGHTNVGMKFERERTRQEEMVSPINLVPCAALLVLIIEPTAFGKTWHYQRAAKIT